MKNQTLLFVMNKDTPDTEIAQYAEAALEQGVHLTCLVLAPAPQLPFYAYGAMPYGGMDLSNDWPEMVRQANGELQTRHDEIETLLSKSGASAEVQSVLCPNADVQQVVAERAMLCDVANVSSDLGDDPEVFREVVHGILFHSPIGLVLNGSALLKANRIFIAWDNGLAASRAIHLALPHLRAAKQVVIGCFDPVMAPDRNGEDPGADLAKWLSHHGCEVTLSQFPSSGQDIAAGIRSRAREFGADLIVMGAYGHSRIKQAVLGGTTRSLLEQTEQRVLMAH